MKFEIAKAGEAVEIRIAEDDGSFTVWICDNEQTAIYKLAALLFSKPEDDKRLKRSILVGTFEPKKVEKKKTIEEMAAETAKRLADSGLVRKGSGTVYPVLDDEKMKELLEKITEKFAPAIQVDKFFPSIPNYPYGGIPAMPYIGDPLPIGITPGWPQVGTVNFTSTKVNPAEITLDSVDDLMTFSNADGLFNSGLHLSEQAVGCFKTKMGATVNVYKASSFNGANS